MIHFVERLIYAALFLSSATFHSYSQEAENAQLSLLSIETTLQEWGRVEDTISKELYEWKAEKAVMTDLVAVLKDELFLLEEKIRESKEETSQVDGQRLALESSKAELVQLRDRVAEALLGVESNLKAMFEKLPPGLQSRVRTFFEKIPESRKASQVPVSQRLQVVTGFLGEVEKFNQVVSVERQLLPLNDNQMVEAKILYFGLGGAFYVDLSGDRAGTIVWNGSGWDRKEEPALASAINEAVSIFERQQQAAFVSLPIEVSDK